MQGKTNRRKCPCGCGQAPAETCRLRKVRCLLCPMTCRVSRECLELGAPLCPAHGPMDVPCLHDRCRLPDENGAAAWAEVTGRGAMHDVWSERSKKAAATRKRRALVTLVNADLPF